jgi:alkanesulfonate monooxygenase SsuD/methylene tetrahydromethanopterin reductase-like flavin-dependent oxidoreductase (luciferase family)
MPLEFSTGIHCEWEQGQPDRISYSREKISLLPPSFTTLWIEDHLQRGTNALLESWTTLSYFAAQFPRFTYGHLVECQSYRNPGLLAKMAATLQYLTGGRFIMGLGAGWKEDEYRAYGYDFPGPGVRVAQLAETIELLRVMWTQSPATYTGQHYQVQQANCEPRPDPMIPILVGSAGKKAMEVAARLADAWTWTGPFEQRFKPLCEQLWRNCEAVGRDPREITIWCELDVDLPDDPGDFIPSGWDAVNNIEQEFKLGPTPADAITQLRPYVEFGITHFIVHMNLPSLKRFCAEVVPAFA